MSRPASLVTIVLLSVGSALPATRVVAQTGQVETLLEGASS